MNLKNYLPVLFALSSFIANAQTNATPKWLSYQFSDKVSLQKALIKINNKDARYADLLTIPDTSILKIEVYSKKEALQFVDKDEAKNGLVMVTLHKKHFPAFSKRTDSVYVIDGSDTVYCTHAQPAMLGDTTNTEWIKFLQHSLIARKPADNGAPAGLYFVDILFKVDKDGKVFDTEVLEDPGYGTAAEVRRLMSQSPTWTPGTCDGKIVIYRQRQRITFAVSEQ